MRKTVYKMFLVWDFDKEEKWLNEMAAKGLVLLSVGFCKYTFEECIPGEYNVRLELLENTPSHTKSTQYIKFIEETGAEYLGSVMRWVYFRRKTDTGEFDLYSDNASRIKHLNRILTLIVVVGILNIFSGFANISIYSDNIVSVFNVVVGVLNGCIGVLACVGFVRVLMKKLEIKKQQNLFE